MVIARRERHRTGTAEEERPESAPRPATAAEHDGPAAADELTAITLAQLDLAIELLRNPTREPAEHTVHETRKALKRLRALMRLRRIQLGSRRYARESSALRDAGRALAVARDAEVMVSTLDEIVERHPERLARSAAVERLRTVLIEERERTVTLILAETEAREPVLIALAQVRARVADRQLEARDEEALRLGFSRLYREGRKRRRRALRHGSVQSRHDWRKRVKDLRYVAETLERPGRPGRRLREVARDAERLGELLGQEHDLALLANRARRDKPCFDGEQATRKDLLKLITRRRKRVRRRALRLGERLYRRSPQAFTRRTLR